MSPSAVDPSTHDLDELRRWTRRRLRFMAVMMMVLPLVALTGPSIAARLIGTGDIKNGAVTAPKIKNNAVTTPKLRPQAVTGPKIKNGGVGSAKLANGSVGPMKLHPAARSLVSAWTLPGPATVVTIDGTQLQRVMVPAPQLTPQRLERSQVAVQMRFGATVLPLPYTSYAGSKANTVHFIPREGNIEVLRFTHDNSASLGFGAVQFRVFTIPTTAAASPATLGAEQAPGGLSAPRGSSVPSSD